MGSFFKDLHANAAWLCRLHALTWGHMLAGFTWLSIARQKAAVLPVPDCDWAIKFWSLNPDKIHRPSISQCPEKKTATCFANVLGYYIRFYKLYKWAAFLSDEAWILWWALFSFAWCFTEQRIKENNQQLLFSALGKLLDVHFVKPCTYFLNIKI